MRKQQEIEAAIREVLAVEKDALALSDALFHPTGLFSQMASTSEERTDLIRTELFQEAQRRLSELQLQEADAFAKDIANLQTSATPRMVQTLDLSAMATPRAG